MYSDSFGHPSQSSVGNTIRSFNLQGRYLTQVVEGEVAYDWGTDTFDPRYGGEPEITLNSAQLPRCFLDRTEEQTDTGGRSQFIPHFAACGGICGLCARRAAISNNKCGIPHPFLAACLLLFGPDNPAGIWPHFMNSHFRSSLTDCIVARSVLSEQFRPGTMPSAP